MKQYDFTYVYLGGASYTGSTMLGLFLASHPQVTTVGEVALKYPVGFPCSCGLPYNKCSFWTDWQQRVEREGLPFEIGNLDINLQPRPGTGLGESLFYYEFPFWWVNSIRNWIFHFSPLYRRWYVPAKDAINRSRLYAQILCEREKASVFLDLGKNPYQIRFLADDPQVNFKVIYMVRDARAQINSNMKREGRTLEEAVSVYKWTSRNLERDIAHYVRPENVYRIRYEDFCDDTDNMMKSLYRFLNLEPFSVADIAINHKQFHIISNTLRESFSGILKREERWRTELTQAQQDYIIKKIGKINRFYGYDYTDIS